jgi:hypothetical protein
MTIDTTRADVANTSSFFSDIIDTLTERGRALLGRKASGAIPQLDLVALGELLLSRRGEASGVLCRVYYRLPLWSHCYEREPV